MSLRRGQAATRISLVAALALVAASLPALAQDNRPRDSSGAIMDLTKWHSMPMHEFMLNVVDLPDAEFTRAERRVRNKGIPHERAWFDGRKGFIFVEHLLVGVYKAYVGERLLDRNYVAGLLEKFGHRRNETFEVLQQRKVYRFGERGGIVGAVRGARTGTSCIVSQFGFLTDWAKMGHRTDERYDTIINFRDCSGKRSLDQVAEWLEGAKIVEPPYNRVR